MNELIKAIYFNLLSCSSIFDVNGHLRSMRRFALVISHWNEIESFMDLYETDQSKRIHAIQAFTKPIMGGNNE